MRRRATATLSLTLAAIALAAPTAGAAEARYVCDVSGRSTTWAPFEYTNQLANPEGHYTYWYVKYVIEGSADCTRVSATGGVELLKGRLTLAGEGSTPFGGNGQPRWDPATNDWDRSANEASWGWLTEFYGAHNREGWDTLENGGDFYQGPFVPEHARIAFPDGTSVEFGYTIRSTNDSIVSGWATGEEKQIWVYPKTGPYAPGWLDDLRGEGGFVSLKSLDGKGAFSAREVGGVTLQAKSLKLGPSVTG